VVFKPDHDKIDGADLIRLAGAFRLNVKISRFSFDPDAVLAHDIVIGAEQEMHSMPRPAEHGAIITSQRAATDNGNLHGRKEPVFQRYWNQKLTSRRAIGGVFTFPNWNAGIAFWPNMSSENSRPVDLRSDTITKPTPAMRAAMAAAEVGDDVFGEDPTVLELEKETAAMLGKEAAMLTPSGTMANQLAVRIQTEPGDEVIVDGNGHIYIYEGGGPAALSGVTCRCLDGRRGVFSAADVEAVLRPPDSHFPRSRLVCLENTHNRGGGKIWPVEELDAVAKLSRTHGLSLHLDGARLWNAAVATGISESRWAAPFDTVSVCFSKGLGAPVGSALAGSKAIIDKARRFRKMFGGGMRQAGIIAAGALYALRNHRGAAGRRSCEREGAGRGNQRVQRLGSIDFRSGNKHGAISRRASSSAKEVVERLTARMACWC
jgi:threonine aldolase